MCIKNTVYPFQKKNVRFSTSEADTISSQIKIIILSRFKGDCERTIFKRFGIGNPFVTARLCVCTKLSLVCLYTPHQSFNH